MSPHRERVPFCGMGQGEAGPGRGHRRPMRITWECPVGDCHWVAIGQAEYEPTDRKSTRLNSSHSQISYAVFCLKKKTRKSTQEGRGTPCAPTTRPFRSQRTYPSDRPTTRGVTAGPTQHIAPPWVRQPLPYDGCA